ncbi:MAG: type 1 glutamine amidotransferase [Lachnospirales bacterium]
MENFYELNFCHLYPDLLNVYGDFGNILILKYRCEQRGIKVNLFNVKLKDDFLYNEMDIVLLGGGQDFEQSIVSEDLKAKAEDIKKYIEEDGVFIGICGGYQLLGEHYITAKGDVVEGLKILPIKTEQGNSRFINDIIIEDLENKNTYVGFENHGGLTYLLDEAKPLGKVLYGNGNNGEDGFEGVRYKNTVGTYLHGSLLAKNPLLADELIKKALYKKYKKEIDLDYLDNTLEECAKEILVEKLLSKK